MKARIIQAIEGDFIRSEIDANDLIPYMDARGFAFIKLNDNARQRAELQGQPKFQGINGPMWDGDAIRYECPETYKALSE